VPEVVVEGVTKTYVKVKALVDATLTVRNGEYLTIVGPSGCGKTTLLRSIAGIVQPDAGEIKIDGTRVTHLPIEERGVGYVFQEIALFPHMNIYDNISYGLMVRGAEPSERKGPVEEMLGMMNITQYRRWYPSELSGGARQKTAISRALTSGATLLLLDEPLGALDKRLRQQMQIELRQIQREVGITTIFVTHDQEEALTLSDRIAIFNEGRVVQVGSPHAVYERPASAFAASFLGDANFFAGRVAAEAGQIETDVGRCIATLDALPPAGARITVAVRPEKMLLETAAAERDAPNRWPGVVKQAVYSGSSITYRVDVGTEIVVFAQNQSAQPLEPGTAVVVTWNPLHSVVVES
jgi:ABC-type Fe3+/spermidine/putrescine transport system ATPase subunit